MPLLCYLDAFSGISGDMLVGALADAGADQAAIVEALASLETGAVLSFERVKRCGIGATKFHVAVAETHAHRHLAHILKLIEKAALPERARQNAAAVFQRLGEVEAAVHQMPDRARAFPRGGRGRFDRRHRGRLPGVRAVGSDFHRFVAAQCGKRNGADGARHPARAGSSHGGAADGQAHLLAKGRPWN